MTIAALAAMLLAGGGADDASRTQWAQLTIQQRMIVRVPTRPATSPAPLRRTAPDRWREKDGPRCIAANALGGATVYKRDNVDLLLKGGKRVRARLEEDCLGLDFYSGFYLRPGKDGKICEDRDSIQARSGAKCQIDKFRALVPGRRK